IFNVRLLRDLLKKLTTEDVCILMSCHVMAEVEELSDQVIFMADGQRRAMGSPSELIKQAGTETLENAFVKFVS
ncbi:MAG: hypothetical protein P8H03_11055, partial [Emcibacteraceae bacterium]|nr:hypothetical protein [Emcibacteraceae bacterium]